MRPWNGSIANAPAAFGFCSCGKVDQHRGRCPGPVDFAIKTGRFYGLRRAYETTVIRQALAAARGNRTRAARQLGLQRTYLLRLMRVRGIR